jgi:hypothetical protein
VTPLQRAAADAIKFTVDQTTLKKKAQLSNGSNSITKAAATAPDLTPTASSKPAPGKSVREGVIVEPWYLTFCASAQLQLTTSS